MSLADATKRIPFSNGTEGQAWMSAWCDLCAHDSTLHGCHCPGSSAEDDSEGCTLIGSALLGDEFFTWPEAWLPEPDDGQFALPSRLVCLHFAPCDPCGGDPGAQERAERIVEVRTYWRENGQRITPGSSDQNGRSATPGPTRPDPSLTERQLWGDGSTDA